MIKNNLTCIICPMGCSLEIDIEDGKITKVSGNTCPRGSKYAVRECTNPTRVITSSVNVKGGKLKIVPVKTEKDVPKDKMFDVIRALKGIEVNAPIYIGDVIVENVLNTGVNIVATRKVESTAPVSKEI